MFERYAELYPKIGAIIAGALPSGWEASWTQVEIDGDATSVIVYYRKPGEEPQWISPPLELADRFRAMHDIARTETPNAAWTQATFVLHADGTFNVDFGYDPVPIEEESVRLAAWKHKYLG